MKFKATLRVEVTVTVEAPSQAEAERLAENVSVLSPAVSSPALASPTSPWLPVSPDDVEVIDVSPSPRSA